MTCNTTLSLKQLTDTRQPHDFDEFIIEISEFDEFEDDDFEDEALDELPDPRVLH